MRKTSSTKSLTIPKDPFKNRQQSTPRQLNLSVKPAVTNFAAPNIQSFSL